MANVVLTQRGAVVGTATVFLGNYEPVPGDVVRVALNDEPQTPVMHVQVKIAKTRYQVFMDILDFDPTLACRIPGFSPIDRG